jgi:transposase
VGDFLSSKALSSNPSTTKKILATQEAEGQEDRNLKPTLGKQFLRHYLEKNPSQKVLVEWLNVLKIQDCKKIFYWLKRILKYI